MFNFHFFFTFFTLTFHFSFVAVIGHLERCIHWTMSFYDWLKYTRLSVFGIRNIGIERGMMRAFGCSRVARSSPRLSERREGESCRETKPASSQQYHRGLPYSLRVISTAIGTFLPHESNQDKE